MIPTQQFWWIAWVSTPTIGNQISPIQWADKTMVKNMPVATQAKIASQMKPITVAPSNPTTVGLVKPIGQPQQEAPHVISLVSELLQWNTWAINNYSGVLSSTWFHNAINLSSDLYNGSWNDKTWINNMKTAYASKWLDSKTIDEAVKVRNAVQTMNGTWATADAPTEDTTTKPVDDMSQWVDNNTQPPQTVMQRVWNVMGWLARWAADIITAIPDTMIANQPDYLNKLVEQWKITQADADKRLASFQKNVSWPRNAIEWSLTKWTNIDTNSSDYAGGRIASNVWWLVAWAWEIGNTIKWIRTVSSAAKADEALQLISQAKNWDVGWQDLLKNKTISKVWESIQPKQTPTNMANAWSKILKQANWSSILSRQPSTSMFTSPKTVPTSSDFSLIESALKAGIDPKGSPEKIGNQMASYLWKNWQAADKIVKDNPIPISRNEIQTKFNNIDDAPSDITDTNKQKIQNIFYKILDSKTKTPWQWNTPDILHAARQEFYQDNSISRILNWWNTDMQEYVKQIAWATKEVIADKIPQYANYLKEETNMFKTLDNISTKFADKSSLGKFITNNKSLLKTIWYAAGLWYAWYEWIQALGWK